MGPSGKNALDVACYADCLGVGGPLCRLCLVDWDGGGSVDRLEGRVWVGMKASSNAKERRFLRGKRTGSVSALCRVMRRW